MLKKIIILLSLPFMVLACGPGQPATSVANQQFGAPVSETGVITYDALLAKMTNNESMPTKVTGKVKEVCQVKGCWMTIVSDQPGQPEMRVTFKDYAFFMPKDIAGKTVVVDGIAVMELISVADQQHYASDAGKSKEEIEKITEPSRELTFEASGVLIKG